MHSDIKKYNVSVFTSSVYLQFKKDFGLLKPESIACVLQQSQPGQTRTGKPKTKQIHNMSGT